MQTGMRGCTGMRWLRAILSKLWKWICFVLLIACALIIVLVYSLVMGKHIVEVQSLFFTNKEAAILVLEYESIFYEPGINPRVDIKLVEEDSYGRKLFCYSVRPNEYLYVAAEDYYSIPIREGVPPKVYLVIQKKTKDRVYYYPTDSICFLANDLLAETDIDELKKKNDWGQPLKEDEMVGAHVDGFKTLPTLEYEEREYLVTSLEKELGRVIDKYHCGIALDEDQNPVYVFREYECERYGIDPIIWKETYAFIMNEQNEVEDYVVLEGDLDDWPKQIQEFRSKTRDGNTGDGSMC